MDSSFLTGLHIGLSLFACLLFFKMLIQFGLPNHPSRFVSYLVSLCATSYFTGLALTDLGLCSPFMWMKWRAFPLIAGSLCLLLQTIMLVGTFSLIQQKVVSRLPLIASLLCFAYFSQYADVFVTSFILIGGLFLIISVRKARYQKRAYLKMMLMFLIHLALNYAPYEGAHLLGQIFLFFTIFYFFLFEHVFGISALVDDLKQNLEGEVG